MAFAHCSPGPHCAHGMFPRGHHELLCLRYGGIDMYGKIIYPFFRVVVFAAGCTIANAQSLGQMHSVDKEPPYYFRKRLEIVHEADSRDFSLRPFADEYAFSDGAVIAVGADADDVLTLAAKDFVDYLDVSMKVSARFARDGRGSLCVSVGDLPARSYQIDTSAKSVKILASDSRTAAQALYHLEDLMNLRRAPFLKTGAYSRRIRFSPRMSHSGWGCDVFPDSHLSQMAHAGMDAILVFLRGVDRTKGNPRYQDVGDIIRRAKKYGLDTYLYSCVVAFAHPDDPGAEKIFAETYGKVAAAYPDAKGIVFVGESCQFPTKDERAQPATFKKRIPGDKRPLAGWWPCRDYPDWVRAVKKAIKVHSKNMEIVFWSYNWGGKPLQPRMELIDNLPQDTTLMATFEMFEPQKKRNGLETRIDDYSISFAGPGGYFATEAERAAKRGLRLYSMANTGGLSWDFSLVPYQPIPFQWKKRYDAICKAQDDWGLVGLMENHHYGWWPSFVSEIEKEALTEGGMPFDKHLRLIAARDFGEENVDEVLAAWRMWSETAEDFVASDENQYGPFRIGPAYPYNFGGERISNADFPCPPYANAGVHIARINYLDVCGYRPQLGEIKSIDANRVKKEIELLESMRNKFDRGADVFCAITRSLSGARADKARRMELMGRFMARTVSTAINIKHGAIAYFAKDKAEILKWARLEYANARATLPIVESDSRLGWEATLDYVGGPEQIRWKLKRMEDLYGSGIKDREQD